MKALKNSNKKMLNFVVLTLLTFFAYSQAPTVSTDSKVTEIGNNTAKVSGDIQNTGTSAVVEKGICYKLYSASGDPDVFDSLSFEVGYWTNSHTFSRTLMNLLVATRYKARAYAINSTDTAYGSTVDFYTFDVEPSAHATSFSANANSPIVLNFSSAGSINNAKGYIILMQEASPISSLPNDGEGYSQGSTVGSATAVRIITDTSQTTDTITALNPGVTYFFKIMPYNFDGTNSETYNYKTDGSIPEDNATTVDYANISTQHNDSITSSSVKTYANIFNTGGGTITKRGFCYKVYDGLDPDTTDNVKSESGSFGTGQFSLLLSPLSAETEYSYRAFAINSAGLSYANNTNDFYTYSLEPSSHPASLSASTVSTSQIDLSFSAASTITNADGYLIVQGQGSIPTYVLQDGEKYIVGSTTGLETVVADISTLSATSTSITNLTSGTKYYYKIYPYNFDGTNSETYNYRTQATVKMDSASTIVAPSTTTSSLVLNINSTTAKMNGNITNTGGENASKFGFCYKNYSSSGAPKISDDTTYFDGNFGVGQYSLVLNSLSNETHYKASSFATNSAATGYGNVIDFYTLALEPSSNTSTFTATTSSTTQIDISYDSAALIGADGYIIVQKQGSAPTGTPIDATSYSVGSPLGDGIVAAVINNPSVTFSSITSVTAGNTYYYKIYPYNWNAIDYQTYNYYITSPTANASTVVPPNVVSISISNFETLQVDFKGGITNTGGENANEIGACYKLYSLSGAPNINDDTTQLMGSFGVGDSTFAVTGLTAATHYKIASYAKNTAGTGYGTTLDFFTYSTEPSAHPSNFTATTSSTSQINLDFDSAGTITNAEGYLIIQKQGSTPSGLPQDGSSYYIGSPIGDGTVAAIISTTSATTTNITSVSAGNTYYFKIIPFNWDENNSETYNYKTDNNPKTANAQTIVKPTVTTSPTINNIKEDSAFVDGTIINTGGANVDYRGACYVTYPGIPTIADDSVQQSGSFGAGNFTVNLYSLSSQTHYNTRAYATNSAGTSYGISYDFYTLSTEPQSHATSFSALTVSTNQINLNFDSAGTITNADGYLVVIKQGSQPSGLPQDATSYSVGSPIGNGTVAALVNGTNITTTNITSVSAGNTYYFKLIPFNWDGSIAETYNYFTDATIPSANAKTIVAPTVTTSSTIYNVKEDSAYVDGNVTSTGGSAVLYRGVCYNTTGNPDVFDNTSYSSGTFGVGTFTSILSGLTDETHYFARAYAANSADTGYGSVVYDFYTLALEPNNHSTTFNSSTSSTTQIDLSFDAASTLGNAEGYVIVQRQGAVPQGFPADGETYSVGSPIGNGTVASVILSSTATIANITSVSAGNNYYFKLFPLNWNGSNGETYNYKTDGSIPVTSSKTVVEPTVTTSPNYTNVSVDSAVTRGQIISTGSENPYVRGFCYQLYDKYSIPDTLDAKIFDNGSFGPGIFSKNLTGLNPETHYQYRAYSQNTSGIGYGNSYDFYTLSMEANMHAALFTATTASTTQIDLDFSKASTILNADGYLIVQRQDNIPTGTPEDATAYAVGSPLGDGIITAIITDANATTTNITSVSAGNTYYYKIYPYNWDYSNSETYNYKIDASVPWDSATTISLPVVTTLSTINNISNVSAEIGGNITNTGGSVINERGICYMNFSSTVNPDTSNSVNSELGSFSTGTFSRNLTGLSTATHYEARAFGINDAGVGYGNSYDFYTTSVEPDNHANSFDAYEFSTTQINLTFSPANTINNAAGYLVIQSQGVSINGTPKDAMVYSIGSPVGNATVVAIINNVSKTTISITNLNAGTEYFYALVPFNWNGSNSGTYNYKTDGVIPHDSATTLSPCPIDPTLTISGSPVICMGDSLLLQTIDTSSGLSYLWTYNGSVISGADSASLRIQEFGDYRVFMSNSFCSVASSIFTLTHYPVVAPKIYATGNIIPCTNDSMELKTDEYSSYFWSTGDTTRNIWVSYSGEFVVTVKDDYGCMINSGAYIVNASSIPSPEICMVTVDTSTSKNIIIWEREFSTLIDSYFVYKETTKANEYKRIGAKPYGKLSVFIDTNSNPAAKADRYKLSSLDTCGVESPLSKHHKTMHLTVNKGIGKENNLIWDHYEGFPFATYKIYRGTKPDSLLLIDSIQNNLTSYSDLNPPQNQVLYYQVAVVNPDTCFPAFLRAETTSGPFSHSLSNLKDYNQSSMAYLDASPTIQNIEVDSGSVAVFTIFTNLPTWNATADSSWITIFKDYSNNSLIAMANKNNPWKTERSVNITVTGNSVNDKVLTVVQSGTINSIEEPEQDNYSLKVYPNPFKGYTNIYYELDKTSNVNIEVYDMIGKRVEVIANESQMSGPYNYRFSPERGSSSKGIYLLRFTIDNKTTVAKLIELN